MGTSFLLVWGDWLESLAVVYGSVVLASPKKIKGQAGDQALHQPRAQETQSLLMPHPSVLQNGVLGRADLCFMGPPPQSGRQRSQEQEGDSCLTVPHLAPVWGKGGAGGGG